MEQAEIVTVTCPKCGKKMKVRRPADNGLFSFPCKNCSNKVVVRFGEQSITKPKETGNTPKPVKNNEDVKTKIIQQGDDANMPKTLIMEYSPGLLRRTIKREIPDGTTVIGRKDYDRPSDISIEHDTSISRRSVSITVNSKNNTYLIKVLQSTNPVLINRKTVKVGEAIYISDGDTLKLGKTTFRFYTI